MSTEAAVIAVAAALYLLDCVVLLERGQALRSGSSLSFGSLHYVVGGRVVALLNPLTPFVPAVRTRPLFSSGGLPAGRLRRALAPLALPCALQLALVFAVLPWCLLRAPGWPFAVALAAAYVNALAMLAAIAWRLGRFRLPRRGLAGLAFGWLACLPLSVNCARRTALVLDTAPDAERALRALRGPERERACAALSAQAAEAMQEMDERDGRLARLAALRGTLGAGDGRA